MKNVLKLSILPIESVFIIEFDVKLKVKIADFSLVIEGKLHSEYLGFSLLVANYSRNIPFFLPWQLAARWQTHILCSLNIPNNSLYNASYYVCRKITSHWQPLFSKKMAAAASFSYKIGGGGLIFLQNWRPHFPTKFGGGSLIFQQNWLRRQGFGNITGGCSDMVWIVDIGLQRGTALSLYSWQCIIVR